MAAKKNKNDFTSLDNEALAERVKAEQMTLTKAVFAHSITPLDNPLSIRNQRRSIARLLTELSSRKKQNAN